MPDTQRIASSVYLGKWLVSVGLCDGQTVYAESAPQMRALLAEDDERAARVYKQAGKRASTRSKAHKVGCLLQCCSDPKVFSQDLRLWISRLEDDLAAHLANPVIDIPPETHNFNRYPYGGAYSDDDDSYY
jgi:hypothetical protein